MRPINFFTDDIKINVHSASDAVYCDRAVTIAEFAVSQPVALYELDNGDLRAELRVWKSGHPRAINGCAFIEGREVK